MPSRSEVVHGELEHRLEHCGIPVLRARGDRIDPTAHRRLVVPIEALPAQHTEVSDDPDRPGGMPLNDRGVEHAGQDDEVAL